VNEPSPACIGAVNSQSTVQFIIEPHWLDSRDALAIDRQIAEHGGISGVRDSNLLDSALARPVDQWNYGTDGPSALAATYAYRWCRTGTTLCRWQQAYSAWVLAHYFWG
jgi:death-on-curing protein